MFHAGLLRKAMEGTRKVEDAARRRTECEDCVPEPSSTYQAVAIWEIEEMYSLVGGLCALGTEAKSDCTVRRSCNHVVDKDLVDPRTCSAK